MSALAADRWIDGDETAIGPAAEQGFVLFNGNAGCANCHKGPSFTDASFHDIGFARETDIGRGRLFPASVKLSHAFEVPTLRDVARRAPYMHNGSSRCWKLWWQSTTAAVSIVPAAPT